MNDMPNCPKCDSEYTYSDGSLFICPECANEWNELSLANSEDAVRDVNGNILVDGDTIVVIKDLKAKGANGTVKQGTTVKNISLANEAGHNISCRIPGMGSMFLKSEFVKKA